MASTKLKLDLFDRVNGVVIDADLWDRESRVRRLSPERFVGGEVVGLWPHAPHVAAVLTPSGERVTVRVLR